MKKLALVSITVAVMLFAAAPMVNNSYAQEPAKEMTKAEQRKAKREADKAKREAEKAKREAEKAEKKELTRSMVSMGTFKFVAERMMSYMPGGSATLDLRNGVSVSKGAGQVISYLPFVGKMYSATPGDSRSPFEFSSKNIEYTEKIKNVGKNVKWIITIKMRPTTGNNYYKYTFDISESGSASLSVTQHNGTGAFYSRHITEMKEQEEE